MAGESDEITREEVYERLQFWKNQSREKRLELLEKHFGGRKQPKVARVHGKKSWLELVADDMESYFG